MRRLFPRQTTPSSLLGRTVQTVIGLTALVALTACAGWRDKLPSAPSIGGLVTPYKIDIVQGNVVTREQAEALRPGMTRTQISDILGTPLLTSVFHADRWDYVFTFRRQGQDPQQRKLTVFFKSDVLDRFEADELPSEAEFVASLDPRGKSGKPPVLEATEEQLKAFDAQNAKSVEAVSATPSAAPATSYPPLEAPGVAQ